MDYALTVSSQVVIMFLLIIAGYVMAKLGIITNDGRKQMSLVVLILVAPALVFMSYQSDYSSELVSGLMWAFVASVITYVITIFMSYIVVRKKTGREDAIERFSLIFTNCGFMGIPLINALFGSEGVLYVTAYITIFHFLSWTLGVMMIKNEMNFSEFRQALKSPTVIAVILGLICYFNQIRVPNVIGQAMNFLGDMNTPLPMIIAGATMAQTDMLKAVRKPRTLLLTFYRLFLIPLICAIALRALNIPEMVYTITIIAVACPVGTTVVLFAVKYEKDDNYASELFSITTLLSAISLPLILMIIRWF